MPEMTVREMQEVAWANARGKGFHEQPYWNGASLVRHDIIAKLGLVASEVGEAVNAVRTDSDLSAGSELAAELADVVLRVADLAAYLGISLEQEISAKFAGYVSRPYLHGKLY